MQMQFIKLQVCMSCKCSETLMTGNSCRARRSLHSSSINGLARPSLLGNGTRSLGTCVRMDVARGWRHSTRGATPSPTICLHAIMQYTVGIVFISGWVEPSPQSNECLFLYIPAFLPRRHITINTVHGAETPIPGGPTAQQLAPAMGHTEATAATYYDKERSQREAQRAVNNMGGFRALLLAKRSQKMEVEAQKKRRVIFDGEDE